MGLASPDQLKEKSTARPPEGWGTFRVNKIRGYEDKEKNPRVVIEWEHSEGLETTQWFNLNNRGQALMFLKLCEYNGISWEEGASIESVGQLAAENIEAMDLNIKWGNGDGVFINDLAPAGQGGLAEGDEPPPAPTPQVAKDPAPKPRRKL